MTREERIEKALRALVDVAHHNCHDNGCVIVGRCPVPFTLDEARDALALPVDNLPSTPVGQTIKFNTPPTAEYAKGLLFSTAVAYAGNAGLGFLFGKALSKKTFEDALLAAARTFVEAERREAGK